MSEPIALIAYMIYLSLSITLTIWVGQTLFTHGRIFIYALLNRDGELTDAINMLLLVGFYLLNIGAVALHLSQGGPPATPLALVEFLSRKLGAVLLLLGLLHFGNMLAIWFLAWVRAGGVLRTGPPDEIARLKAEQR